MIGGSRLGEKKANGARLGVVGEDEGEDKGWWTLSPGLFEFSVGTPVLPSDMVEVH